MVKRCLAQNAYIDQLIGLGRKMENGESSSWLR